MATVKYTIVSGDAPFVAQLYPSQIPVNNHAAIGTFQFDNVSNGGYTLIITDSNGCSFQQEVIVDPNVSTTTTTGIPGSSIVVGQTNDENLIFNVDGTNRDSHYEGYPNPNTSTVYLWLKTSDGAPLTVQKVLNYTLAAESTSTFLFNGLSDEIHAEVLQTLTGPATTITGQLILKAGFIETFFQYTYVKNPTIPNYQIDLNSNINFLYTDIPLTDGLNIYGVTYIDGDNVIMKF